MDGGKDVIHTLTLNPAIDRLLFIEAYRKNDTNRIKRMEEVLGGKGTHVSLNLAQLDVPNVCFGVAKGETGRRIIASLQRHPQIDVEMLYTEDGESRTNYAVIEEDQTCTLITEKGDTLEADLCWQLLDRMEARFMTGDILVLSGDASNTEIPFFYNVVMERLAGKAPRVFLDTSSDNLSEGLKGKPYLVKPNLDELSQIVGRPVRTEAEIIDGMDYIEREGVQVVAVSCGSEGSYVRQHGKTYRIFPLPVAVRNTIGCGDAYLSGLVCGLAQEKPLMETLRLTTAISAATAESPLTVGFDVQRAMELVDAVRVDIL